ncbi:RICIN domain-containing protein [Cerasibacillus sp. JNUCC 74]
MTACNKLSREPYSLIITSDPQYPWTPEMDIGNSNQSESEKKRKSEELIRSQYQSINSYTDSIPNSSVIINGDMTAFGHSWQWSEISKLLKILKKPYYYGLGNHDIENNINDCYANECFGRSMEHLINFINRLKLPSFQVDFKLLPSSTVTVKSYRGSFAYAIDFGDIYSIQLNNFPTMKVKIASPFSAYPNIDMVPNLDWLEKQLEFARSLGKIIIVNVHKPNDWSKYAEPQGPNQRFIDLLKQYSVTAVFCGHYHLECGKQQRYQSYFGDIPVFLSGSASQSTYLIAEYHKDTLDVYSIRSNNWNNKRLEQSIWIGDKNPIGPYKIVTALNDSSVIDLNKSDDNNVTLWKDHSGNNQKWKFEYDNEKEAYQIRSVSENNLVLAWIIDTLDSRKVWAHRNEYKEEHYWILEEQEDGYYIIKNKKNPNFVLDVDGAKTENGTKIKVNERHNSSEWVIKAQKFKIIR